MPKPIFFVVSPDAGVRDGLTADLSRRFGADYQVGSAHDARSGLDALDAAVGTGDGSAVALLIADQHLGPGAVEFLTSAHRRFRTAKRILLIDRGDWSADHPAIAALAVGEIDFHLYRPWWPREQILYPAVSEFLASWNIGLEPSAVALRICGSRRSARAHELRDLLTRASVPFWFYDEDSDEGRQLLAEAGVDGSELPVAIYHDGTVLVAPSNGELMSTLGVATTPGTGRYDVAIVGAGPAGLAAAVYAASEGLHTVLLEPVLPGGQAGSSSLIRNYLGFQRGVTGAELTNRAVEQAWLFGAELVLDQRAVGLEARGSDRVVRSATGDVVSARTVVLATGVSWRRLAVPELEALVGAGVFYGAAGAEARAMRGRHVFVVGAGNSAGQAVLHLARHAATVTLLVRGPDLARTMSEYLITEIGTTPQVIVRLDTEVVGGDGDGYLETLTLRNRRTGHTETVAAAALFLLIGAQPHTDWLGDGIARDARGFVLTGRDVADLPGWPLRRAPFLLETTIPGVFAAGDVRNRSVKRVAAAVGEGATAIQLVHEYLSEPS